MLEITMLQLLSNTLYFLSIVQTTSYTYEKNVAYD